MDPCLIGDLLEIKKEIQQPLQKVFMTVITYANAARAWNGTIFSEDYAQGFPGLYSICDQLT